MNMMPDEEFKLLAPFFALDTLDESEHRAFTEELYKSPELQSELNAFEAAVAAIAYTVPPVPVAPNLKHRLFQRIAELSPIPKGVNSQPVIPAAQNNTFSVIVRSKNVK